MISNDDGESDVTPTESEATGTVGNDPHGSWEIPGASTSSDGDRSAKARRHKADMHVTGKSDSLVVPEKRVNNAGTPRAAESVEERRLTKENVEQPLRDRTQSRAPRSRGLFAVREIARRDKKMRFNNLLNHVTPELLKASFFDLKKQAAPGIDGATWDEYAENFEARITDLHTRIHRETYRAKPSKRTWIPKLDGKLRPLGIASLEDKIVQQAARVVLECIYEEDFLGFSYGFHPGRSCHRALDALSVGITHQKVNWVLDADIGAGKGRSRRSSPKRTNDHRSADGQSRLQSMPLVHKGGPPPSESRKRVIFWPSRKTTQTTGTLRTWVHRPVERR